MAAAQTAGIDADAGAATCHGCVHFRGFWSRRVRGRHPTHGVVNSWLAMDTIIGASTRIRTTILSDSINDTRSLAQNLFENKKRHHLFYLFLIIL
jgi:hypothetical protein